MKKKILSFALVICVSLLLATIFTGCQSIDQNEVITIPTDFTVTMEGEEITQHRITIINDSDCGAIYPKLDNGSSSVLVDEGDSYTVTIKAEEGFKLDYLLINAEKVEAVEVYTFNNVTNDQTISAVFSEIIDKRHSITEINMKGMIFELSQTTENQEVKSLDYTLTLSNFYNGGYGSSTDTGYVYCGNNQASKFTNSLNFTNFNISFNDSTSYKIVLTIGKSNVLSYSFIPNKMELEYVSDNIYMIKLDNNSTSGYNLENIVLYFAATFE